MTLHDRCVLCQLMRVWTDFGKDLLGLSEILEVVNITAKNCLKMFTVDCLKVHTDLWTSYKKVP